MTDRNGEKLIGPEQLGEMVGLPANSIRRLARQGVLPVIRFGKLMRFSFPEVKEALKQTTEDESTKS